jgi:hypothetical protein
MVPYQLEPLPCEVKTVQHPRNIDLLCDVIDNHRVVADDVRVHNLVLNT